MPKEERRRVVLQFLDERDAMFKRRALYDNLREYEGITFSEQTVGRYLNEFKDDGLVEQTEEYGYWRITEKGREYLRD